MKYISIIAFVLLNLVRTDESMYTTKNAKITIFSHALIEDIKAETPSGVSVYNAITGELYFSVNISALKFDKAFMQEHFNSDYMESDKYPKAIFRGNIVQHVDISKDGNTIVDVTGELTVHGITEKRTVQGSLTVKNGIITMSSEFMVNCADHHIDIPQILFYHIAETIKVTVSATYNAYKTNPSK